MLGTPSSHASLRVAQHPAQQPKVIWAVYCLPSLERGQCAHVRIFLMSVVIPECLPSSLPTNAVAILVNKTAWNKAQFPPDWYFSFKLQSQPSYSWQSETRKPMPCTPPKRFPTWRQQSSTSITKHEAWQTCNLNHSFNFVPFPGSDCGRALQHWLGETLPADTWKAIWNACTVLPHPADTHAVHSRTTSAMSSQFCTSKRGNVGRCRKPQRQTWSEGGVNHRQLFLQRVPVSPQQQVGVCTHTNSRAVILGVCRHQLHQAPL